MKKISSKKNNKNKVKVTGKNKVSKVEIKKIKKIKTKNDFKVYDTIIIGAGIAGCTAAIYAARKRMNFLLITEKFGGQFFESGEVLNYPGIVKTTGAEFSKVMEEQLKFNGVTVNEGIVVEKIFKKGKYFVIKADLNGKEKNYLAKSVIIATGSHPRKLNVPGEEKFKKRGLTYCAICDGPLFTRKDVAVIGGGDSALEAVDFLDKIAKKIYLVVRGDKLKAHEYLQEKIKNNPKVQVLFNSNTTEIVGNRFVTGIKYESGSSVKGNKEIKGKKKIKELKELKVQGIFVEIGRTANTDFVKNLVKVDEHGHIIVDCQTNTSLPGIFAAGDCSSVHEYQYVISAGTACLALLKAAKYLAVGNK